MNKRDLRNWAKEKRMVLNIEALSNVLVTNLRAADEYKNAKHVMLFYPLENEVNLLDILKDDKKFYLPRIDGENLLCCPYEEDDNTCLSCFKTVEPLSEPTDKNLIDLVIVPALCVDKNNYRLGYGGGFYDRFLKNCTAKTVVCISKQLVIDTIYPEEFDVPVDLIITD